MPGVAVPPRLENVEPERELVLEPARVPVGNGTLTLLLRPAPVDVVRDDRSNELRDIGAPSCVGEMPESARPSTPPDEPRLPLLPGQVERPVEEPESGEVVRGALPEGFQVERPEPSHGDVRPDVDEPPALPRPEEPDQGEGVATPPDEPLLRPDPDEPLERPELDCPAGEGKDGELFARPPDELERPEEGKEGGLLARPPVERLEPELEGNDGVLLARPPDELERPEPEEEGGELLARPPELRPPLDAPPPDFPPPLAFPPRPFPSSRDRNELE